jgi:hypothetical protein
LLESRVSHLLQMEKPFMNLLKTSTKFTRALQSSILLMNHTGTLFKLSYLRDACDVQ